jgi:sarcosine oxidase, subunit gamma
MSAAPPLRIFPLSPDGAASGVPLPHTGIALADFTARPRFGVKGPGTSAWLASQVGPLPAINHVVSQGGLRIHRLGGEDVLVTGTGCDALAAAWRSAGGPRGYWSWREEGWAWLRLDGAGAGDVMARLCAVDLRPGRFPPDGLAQTRMAQVDTIIVPDGSGFDLFFDIASTAFVVRSIASAAQRAAVTLDRPVPADGGG